MSKLTDASDRIVHSAVFDVAIGSVKAAAIADSPWLALPVISDVFDLLLLVVGNMIFKQLSTMIDFKIIEFQTEDQRKEYEASVNTLKSVAQKEGVTNGEIEDASSDFRSKLSSLIRLQ